MNKPKIRFKGFEGEWKDSMLSDFSYSICSGRDTAHKGIYPLYGSTGIIGTTNKPSYNGAMLLVARVGANAGKLQIINEECGVSDNTLIIKPNGNISVSWLYYYLVHCNLNHLVYGSGQPLITGYMLKRIPILLGSKKECDEIASYFTALDTQIAASTSRLSSLKQIKAASLLNMFPQKGETVPRVRFKGFEGEWKEMQFGVAFEYQRNNSLSRAELSDEGIVANIHYGDVLIKYGECLNVSKDVLTYVKDEKIGMALYKKGALRNGDVIFADAAEDNTVGKCTEVICEENVCIVSGLHTIACRPQVEVVERYLGYSLNSPSFHNQLLPHIQGTKISSISKNALSSTSIFLPSLPEQQAIASYFTALDAKITLHRERLEKLKQIKAACLEKMFA